MSAYDITLMLYNITLFPVIFFSLLFLTLTTINLVFFSKKEKTKYKEFAELPKVTVQIPTFNDPIAVRCVESCLKFTYPKDKFDILIVDDSTDVQTQMLLNTLAEKHESVSYVHRNNRNGYKPGALKAAMKHTTGEIIVVFDADWIPRKDFLQKIVKPFSDPNVALVQSRQGFSNKNTNFVSRFAAYTLMIYHTIVMPINNTINCVFFCGTAGALRKKAFDEVGGWNLSSITEDSDLSVKLIHKGYKTVYLEFETPSEVPDTIESFVKQQMRWCYGNVRVFMDNASKIIFSSKFKIKQKAMILYILLSHAATPAVALMTILGSIGWFIGTPTLFTITDLIEFFSKFLITMGFIVMGIITLMKLKKTEEIGYFIATTFSIGIILAFTNAYAFIKAILNKPLSWYCTPKVDNTKIVQ